MSRLPRSSNREHRMLTEAAPRVATERKRGNRHAWIAPFRESSGLYRVRPLLPAVLNSYCRIFTAVRRSEQRITLPLTTIFIG